jgi:hypothetical protein
MILFFLLSIISSAQEDPQITKNHSIGIGFDLLKLKEELLIPKVNTGLRPSLLYRFEKTGTNFSALQFSIGYGKLKTELETEKLTQAGNISFMYFKGYRLIDKNSIELFLGFNGHYSWSIYEYPIWDEARAYWNTYLSTGPYARLEIPMKSDKLCVISWNIGLAGIQSRPDEVRLYAQEKWTIPSILATTHSNFKPGLIKGFMFNSLKAEFGVPFKKGKYFFFSYSLSYSINSKNNGPPIFVMGNEFCLRLEL